MGIDYEKFDFEHGSVYWFKSVIHPDDCIYWCNKIDQKRPDERKIQDLRKDNGKIPAFFTDSLNPVLEMVDSDLELRLPYTISRHNHGQSIGWHRDKVVDKSDRFKLCIYLSQSVGTEFEKSLVVPANCGDVVVFDLSLLHRGTKIPKGVKNRKYMLGFRVNKSNIKI